jgi:hypothetical protein
MDNKGRQCIREMKEMPDYTNEVTKATEVRLGPFVFDKEESHRSND